MIRLVTIPRFDKWRHDQENREMSATVDQIQAAIPNLVIQMNEEFQTLYGRLEKMEKAQERLQLLLSAIQRDLPAITKDCPHVLAVAANIAIEDGGLDKP